MSEDKVRFVADERLDIPDATALQTLSYDYHDRVLGSVVGYGQGIVSTSLGFQNTGNGGKPHEYALSDCLIYQQTDPGHELTATEKGKQISPSMGVTGQKYSAPLQAKGRVVRHDTSIASVLIDLGPTEGAKEAGVIYAKIAEINTDPDTRRKWNAAQQTEDAFTTDTRTRVYVSELRAQGNVSKTVEITPHLANDMSQGNPPDATGDWVAITYYYWDGNDLEIRLIWGLSGFSPASVSTKSGVTISGWDEVLNEIYETSAVDPLSGANPTKSDYRQGWWYEQPLFSNYVDEDGANAGVDPSMGYVNQGLIGLAQQISDIRVQLARLNYHQRGVSEVTTDTKVSWWGYPRKVAPGYTPQPASDGAKPNPVSPNLTNSRWNGIPRLSLVHAAWMLGTGDQIDKAFNQSTNIWIPLSEHPSFANNSVLNRSYFLFGTATLTGAGDGTDTWVIQDDSMTSSTTGGPIGAQPLLANNGNNKYVTWSFRTRAIPEVRDAEGNLRKIRFTHITMCANVNAANNAIFATTNGTFYGGGFMDHAGTHWTQAHANGTTPEMTVRLWQQGVNSVPPDSLPCFTFALWARILDKNDA